MERRALLRGSGTPFPCRGPFPGGSKYLLNEHILCFCLKLKAYPRHPDVCRGKGWLPASSLSVALHYTSRVGPEV